MRDPDGDLHRWIWGIPDHHYGVLVGVYAIALGADTWVILDGPGPAILLGPTRDVQPPRWIVPRGGRPIGIIAHKGRSGWGFAHQREWWLLRVELSEIPEGAHRYVALRPEETWARRPPAY